MTTELIARFLEAEKAPAGKIMKIDFKKRDTIYGFIVEGKDYEDLKSKNFWRIVFHTKMKDWERTKSLDLAKIYSGSEFTKISFAAAKEVV
jgi:hypothetical protein